MHPILALTIIIVVIIIMCVAITVNLQLPLVIFTRIPWRGYWNILLRFPLFMYFVFFGFHSPGTSFFRDNSLIISQLQLPRTSSFGRIFLCVCGKRQLISNNKIICMHCWDIIIAGQDVLKCIFYHYSKYKHDLQLLLRSNIVNHLLYKSLLFFQRYLYMHWKTSYILWNMLFIISVSCIYD